jgi:hypothetical protein
VPAPTKTSGTSFAMRLMASAPCAVLNVTSAHGMPPEESALAKGTAFSTSSILITGTMPIFSRSCNTLCIDHPPKLSKA